MKRERDIEYLESLVRRWVCVIEQVQRKIKTSSKFYLTVEKYYLERLLMAFNVLSKFLSLSAIYRNTTKIYLRGINSQVSDSPGLGPATLYLHCPPIRTISDDISWDFVNYL